MGSIEEERLGEMVHDFIESESTPLSRSIPTPPHHYSNTLPMPPAAPPYNQTNYSTLQAIVGRSTKAEAQVLERVLNHITRINKNHNIITSSDGIRNLLVTKLKMDGYNASLCHTSWVTSLGCPAGDYEYIDINMVLEKAEEEEEEGKNGNSKMKKRRVIVDIEFKSQFEVARPTPAYKHLTDSLPMIFVGTEDKLIQIISILCSAAKQSLIDRGLHVPPWRSTAYMHSKWLSHSPDPYSNINYNYIITKKYSNWEWTPPNPDPDLDPDPDPDNPIFNNIKPANKNKIRNLGGVSALSTQFSNMSINCC